MYHRTKRSSMNSLSSTGAVLVNRVRSSVPHILKVLPSLRAPATMDAHREFLTGVSPFEPCTLQETLNVMYSITVA